MLTTESLIRAAAQDAGNRSMRKAGRKRWNLDDQIAASEAYWSLVLKLGTIKFTLVD